MKKLRVNPRCCDTCKIEYYRRRYETDARYELIVYEHESGSKELAIQGRYNTTLFRFLGIPIYSIRLCKKSLA